MKLPHLIFNPRDLAERIADIDQDSEEGDHTTILLLKVFPGPLTPEKIKWLVGEWKIPAEGAFVSPDPVTIWNAILELAKKATSELSAGVNAVLEMWDMDTMNGKLEFQMKMDQSFGLFYIYGEQSPNDVYDEDIVVEPVGDGSYIITQEPDEPLGMAEDWNKCQRFIYDHLDKIGYWADDFKYEIRVFLRSEGKLKRVKIDPDVAHDNDEH